MAQERYFQERQGKYMISFSQLLQRLPEGVGKRLRRYGSVPEKGTGKHSIINEYARVATERRTNAITTMEN